MYTLVGSPNRGRVVNATRPGRRWRSAPTSPLSQGPEKKADPSEFPACYRGGAAGKSSVPVGQAAAHPCRGKTLHACQGRARACPRNHTHQPRTGRAHQKSLFHSRAYCGLAAPDSHTRAVSLYLLPCASPMKCPECQQGASLEGRQLA